MTRPLILLALLVLAFNLVSHGQVPNKISYQGLLTIPSGSPVPDGNYNLKFEIFNLPSGGTLRHSETHNGVQLARGTFSVTLGPMPAIFSESLYVEVTALAGSPGISSDLTFSPRSELTSAPYALHSHLADTADYVRNIPLSQWVTNGSHIYYNSGNVGIGTTTPSAKLEVAGHLKLSGYGILYLGPNDDANEGAEIEWRGAGAHSVWHQDINGDKMRIWSDVVGAGNNLVLDDSGNVGIGTSVPNDKLEITGNLRLPATTATTGMIKAGADRFIHNYGTGNTFVGVNAGNLAMTGDYNTANGSLALYSNTTGRDNTANGFGALYANTTGTENTALGSSALASNIGGLSNTAIGRKALTSNTSGNSNVAIGMNALAINTSGNSNVAVGSAALFSNTIGEGNVANGGSALAANTTGLYNTAVGTQALSSNSTANNNTANGYRALFSNTTGSYNTAVGTLALTSNTTADNNTANGYRALYSNTLGNNNTASGYQALYSNTTGHLNTADGLGALRNNTTGFGNTAIGSNALAANVDGPQNTAVGRDVLLSNTSGSSNVAVGNYALAANTTGSGNTALGFNTSVSANNFTNATAIGFGAIVNASNKVRIGNTAVTVIEGQVAWSWPSDVRVKKDIKESNLGLEFINKLRPVSFKMKTATDDNLNYGFIAQEVEAALEGLKSNMVMTSDDADKMKTMRYTELIAPLVKAVQEQHRAIKEQEMQIEELKALVKSLASGKKEESRKSLGELR